MTDNHNLPVGLSASEIGRMAGAAYLRYEAAEQASTRKRGSCGQNFRAKSVAADFSDMEYALRDLISAVPAKSDEDAIVQLAWATSLLDMLSDMWPETAETFESEKLFRHLRRILFSVLDHAESKSGLKVTALVAPDWDNAHINPWRCIAEGEGTQST